MRTVTLKPAGSMDLAAATAAIVSAIQAASATGIISTGHRQAIGGRSAAPRC